MAGALGTRRSGGLVLCLGVVVMVMLLLGLATPACSLLINSSSPLTCSSQCESEQCSDPIELRYGKYCGVGYTGCSGQVACDGLDTCCQTHDRCIGPDLGNYLNRTCNENLKTCVTSFRNSNQPQFAGANCSASTIEEVIIVVMDIATVGSHGNPSFSKNLHWATISGFIVSLLLLHS